MTGRTGEKTSSLPDVMKSLFAALLGVQSYRNYERDFKHGKAWQFILAGVIGVGVFILLIIAVVMIVIRTAGT